VTKPLSPKDVESAKTARQGNNKAVIEAANELIAQRWNGHDATFKLHELAKLAREKLGWDARKQFEDGDLDIEPIFRKAGWSVDFDRPGYNETYEAHFIFTKRRTR
jgi:hypothetical protein